MICVLITLIGSIFLINEAVQKFRARKIAIKISDVPHEIGSVPFPAITICPELLITDSLFEELMLKNISKEE